MAEREHYTDAIASVVVMMDVIRRNRWVPPASDVQAFCDAVVVHLRALANLQIKCRPKHHILMELGARLRLR